MEYVLILVMSMGYAPYMNFKDIAQSLVVYSLESLGSTCCYVLPSGWLLTLQSVSFNHVSMLTSNKSSYIDE